MSGPFGVNMTVISGQKYSREIVVAAATFLSMGFLSIRLVANDGTVRQEFLKALDIFKHREGIDYREIPDSYAKRLIEPRHVTFTKDLFWLALDKEGESLAKDILVKNGELPDKRVHQSVHKLNLIEQTILPPPQVQIPLQSWEECRHKHFSLSVHYHKLKPKESLLSYMSANAPLSPDEKSYLAWCESLYESLIPWQDNVKTIQSDFS